MSSETLTISAPWGHGRVEQPFCGCAVWRYYDPETGQSITVDPFVDFTVTPYAYVADDPINSIDPSGNLAECADSGDADAAMRELLSSYPHLSDSQIRDARLVYALARKDGHLTRERALEIVAAAFAESSLRPGLTSPCYGLLQLCRSGPFLAKAGGPSGAVNPTKNVLAILPAYVAYWRRNPNAPPGSAAAAKTVENSGESASFYAAPLKWIWRYLPK